jgi:hypothetical protein
MTSGQADFDPKRLLDPNVLLAGGMILAGIREKDRTRREMYKRIAKNALKAAIITLSSRPELSADHAPSNDAQAPHDSRFAEKYPRLAQMLERAQRQAELTNARTPNVEQAPIAAQFAPEQPELTNARTPNVEQAPKEAPFAPEQPRDNVPANVTVSRICRAPNPVRIPRDEIACTNTRESCTSYHGAKSQHCRERVSCAVDVARTAPFVITHGARSSTRRTRASCGTNAPRAAPFVITHGARSSTRRTRAPCATNAPRTAPLVITHGERTSTRRTRAP